MVALIVAAVLASSSPETAEFIQKISPNTGPNRAKHFARIITAQASRYDVDPKLLAVIVKQESNFEPAIKSCFIVHRYKQCRVTCDYGAAQINEVWVKKWRLDREKLQHNDWYNIRVAARLLSQLQREYGHEPDWYGRYHSGTPSKKAIYLKRLDTLFRRQHGSSDLAESATL